MKLSELLSNQPDTLRYYLDDVEISECFDAKTNLDVRLVNLESVALDDAELSPKQGVAPGKMVYTVEDMEGNELTLRVTIEKTATLEDYHDAKVEERDKSFYANRT